MNKAKILVCLFVAAMALTSCNREDNPVPDPVYPEEVVDVDNPNEVETDQPAYAPEM